MRYDARPRPRHDARRPARSSHPSVPADESLICDLRDTEVHVWYLRTDEARTEECWSSYQRILSLAERDRAARFVFDTHRRQFVLSHALVRLALSCYAPCPPEAWSFATTALGRPEIDNSQDEHPHLRFSLSHTSGLAAVAIASDHDIGLDAESLERSPVEATVVRRCLAPSEMAALARAPVDDRDRAFVRLWTLKEAYLKARGIGLACPLDALSFHRDGAGRPVMTCAPHLDDDAAGWTFEEAMPTPCHTVAIAVRPRSGRTVSIQVREARFVPSCLPRKQ